MTSLPGNKHRHQDVLVFWKSIFAQGRPSIDNRPINSNLVAPTLKAKLLRTLREDPWPPKEIDRRWVP